MLLTASFGFIRQSALNVKAVRAGQISRIIWISTGQSRVGFKSNMTRFTPWAVRKATMPD